MTKKSKELIKSIILVVLFFTTILLLYFVFVDQGNVDIAGVIPLHGQNGKTVNTEDVVIPKELIISHGDGSFGRSSKTNSLYRKTLSVFADASQKYSMMAADITKEQYLEAKDNYESFELVFAFELPFSQFCSEYGIKRNSTFNTIQSFTSICFSDAAKQSVLVANEKNGKYYRIMSDVPEDVNLFERTALGNFTPEEICYKADSVFGSGGNILVPISALHSIAETSFRQESPVEESYAFSQLQEKLFGSEVGFLRRISDGSGNTSFMYGYGQKVLSLYADGSLEYKEEASSGEEKTFFEDLQAALNFNEEISNLIADTTDTKFVLVSASESRTGRDLTRSFGFLQSLAGELIMPEIVSDEASGKYALEIGVINGRVVSYKRNAVCAYEHTSDDAVIDAANAISSLSIAIYRKNLLDSGADTTVAFSEEDAYRYTVEQLKGISSCYLKTADEKLVPSWCIELKDGSKVWTGLKQKQY